MKYSVARGAWFVLTLLFFLALVGGAGCASPGQEGAAASAGSVPAPVPGPGADAEAAQGGPGPGAALISAGSPDLLRPNDLVTITFADVMPPLKNYEERIKDDGTITPPTVSRDGPVQAAGKTTGQLQRELQQRYEKYYRRITVTVLGENRFFYVDGQVRSPGGKPYVGEITLVKAIAVAGGCTDFAKKTKVQLTRANGKKLTVNYEKALKDQALDPPVYPGDQIYIPRRL
jgi:polysaccharide export outer membrane protein